VSIGSGRKFSRQRDAAEFARFVCETVDPEASQRVKFFPPERGPNCARVALRRVSACVSACAGARFLAFLAFLACIVRRTSDESGSTGAGDQPQRTEQIDG